MQTQKFFRKKKGLSQLELAELVNIEMKSLSRIESGHNYPQCENLIAIANALNVDPWQLYFCENKIDINKMKQELINAIETSMTAAQKFRYVLYPVTADNFTLMINRITNEKESYKIKVVICFARNEIEQNRLFDLISDAISKSRYYQLVFIDASSNLINREVFKRWVENKANEKHWRGKDNALADKMRQNADDCLADWQKSLENGSFVYYPALKNEGEKRKGISCQGIPKIIEEFKDNVRKIFPYTFDNADIPETLFQINQWKKFSEAGIQRTEYSMLKNNVIKIILGDIWQISGKYWEVYPDLNISRLKIELDTAYPSMTFLSICWNEDLCL